MAQRMGQSAGPFLAQIIFQEKQKKALKSCDFKAFGLRNRMGADILRVMGFGRRWYLPISNAAGS